MKKALAVAGILALSIAPTASFADHLEPKRGELRPRGNLAHTNLSGVDLGGAALSFADLSGANLDRAFLDNANLNSANLRNASLSGVNLSGTSLSGIIATNLRGCPDPRFLPNGWVCENNSLIQR